MKLFSTVSPLVFGDRGEGWPRQAVFRIAFVVLLHLGLLWIFTRPSQIPAVPDNRVWLQLLQPTPSVFTPRKTVDEPKLGPRLAPRLAPQHTPAPSIATPPPASPVVTPSAQTAPAAIVDGLDELAQPSAASTPPTDMLQRALKAAGAIDRQLRAEHKQEFTAPPDTASSRLARGFAEAHAAVGPKWNEAARIELFSAPNDPKRIYRVTTAMGEYCVFFADKGSIAENGSAKAGWAGFGQASMSKCPIKF